MPTIEEVRAKIRKNFPKEGGSRDGTLKWERETATTIISLCGTYRCSRHYDKKQDIESWWTALCTTSTAAGRNIAGPFDHPRQARQAAQDYQNGEPMQQDLTMAKS